MLFWKKEEEEKPGNRMEKRGSFLYSEKLKESMDEEEMQDQLCELMEMYQAYHDIAMEKQYALRGSQIRCQYGTRSALLDMTEDHGVCKSKVPVMACSDCHERNIHNFGSCMCPEGVYEKRLPMTPPVHRNGEPAVLKPGNRYPHICIPLVSKNGWQQEEDGVLIEDSGQVSPALVDSATLICQYGGIIMIWEVPEKPGEQEECIILDDWLYLYYEPTVLSAGRHVEKHEKAANYDWAMPEDLSGKDENWFATESPAHNEITKHGEFQVQLNSNNLYTDYEGRYWVAIGPNFMNPDHLKERVEHDLIASEMNYGTKIDIVVEDKEGITYYIPAVVGDAKEHSYPDGLYQTGVPFNKDRPDSTDKDTNTIEFIGYDILKKIYEDGKPKYTINITNDYRLIEIIVYDGVFNYE